VRHAHRSKKQGREIDNGLSETGRDQARRIKRHFKKVYPKNQPFIVTSPKLRCIETILPLAGAKKDAYEIMLSLDEGANLSRRVKEFIRWWKQEAPWLTVACSHGDWIPMCVEQLTGLIQSP
jgi:broad specificity phosphatase PhoE